MNYAEFFRQSGLDRSDTLALFTHATGLNRAWLIAHDRDEISPEHLAALQTLIARRQAGEPVAYIVGLREFFGRDFAVNPAVLIPRPDTELLVELALARAPQNARVIDLGTGSGCIPITLKLERPDLAVSALDISPDALAVARGNAERLGAKVRFVQSDWFTAVGDESFDLIVSNPPYIHRDDHHLQEGDLRFEPRGALTDEADGLAHLRHIAHEAKSRLKAGGWLLMEHGWDQGTACRKQLADAGYADVATWQDLGGNDRVSGGKTRL
jgi:release factor glutamine methyltransferase